MLFRGGIWRVALISLLLGWLAFNWVDTARHLVEYYNPLPQEDYWRVVEDLSALKRFEPSPFWRQHNEHRIVFPELVFAIDMLWLRGRQLLPTLLSFGCHFASWIVLARVAWRERTLPAETRFIAIMLAGILLGWSVNSLVLGVPFLLQWTLVEFAVVLAFALLASMQSRDREGAVFQVRTRRLYLIPVIACGVIATYSSANGMVLWPVLIGAAIMLRIDKTQIAVLIAAAVVSITFFFVGYHSPARLNLLALLTHPLRCAAFVLSFVSMPFGVLRNPVFGYFFGAANIVCWISLAICVVRTRALLPASRVMFFGWYAFILLTALMIAAGRLDVQDPGFGAAKSGRYVTLPLITWAALIEAAIVCSKIRKWKIFRQGVIIAIAIAVLPFMQVRLARWLRSNDVWMAAEKLAALSFENGILEPSLILDIFPDVSFVSRYLPELKRDHLSIYSGNSNTFLGNTVNTTTYNSSTQLNRGKILQVIPVHLGFEIVGLTKRREVGRVEAILFVDNSNRVIGFGRRVRPLCFPQFFSRQERDIAWIGFINSKYAARAFWTYISRGSDLIPIAPAHPLENF